MNRVRPIRSIGGYDQRGVGLIEVLISLVVLSFGMLGLAGLQMWSLKNNQGSMERSMAVVETHSIVDAMRADRATATTGGFNVAIGPDAQVPTVSPFAQSALTAWFANLKSALGDSASGGVTCNGEECTVTVRWSDQRSSTSGRTEAQTVAQQEVITVVRL